MTTSGKHGAGGAEPVPEEEAGRGGRELIRADGVVLIVARHAGYCYGVERALAVTETALARASRPVDTLGPIIHNPSVVRQLQRRGAEVVERIEDARGGTLIVRTHGVPPEVLTAARARGLEVVDATCPFVAVAQRKAAILRAARYTVVILGERDHPEVAGLAGYAGPDAIVVEDADGLPLDTLRGRRVGLVVQTTQTRANLASVAAALAPVARELLVHNTICDATEKHQSAACELAAQVDVVVVIGGRNSANTARLAQLCRALQPRTYHVESAAELQPEWFAGARRIGITAGASTPAAEINAALAVLGGFGGD